MEITQFPLVMWRLRKLKILRASSVFFSRSSSMGLEVLMEVGNSAQNSSFLVEDFSECPSRENLFIRKCAPSSLCVLEKG